MKETTPSRPAGRPIEFDPEDTARSAVEVFRKDGFAATTTRQLEAELGVNQSSLYRVFESKKGLLGAALVHYRSFTDSELLHPLRDGSRGVADIQSYFERLQRNIGNGCLLVCLMGELNRRDAHIVDQTATYRADIREAFREALLRSAQLDEIAPDAVDGHAGLLTAAVLGINIAARGGATEEELDELFDDVITVVKGLGAN